jgi:hypothetical protein
MSGKYDTAIFSMNEINTYGDKTTYIPYRGRYIITSKTKGILSCIITVR